MNVANVLDEINKANASGITTVVDFGDEGIKADKIVPSSGTDVEIEATTITLDGAAAVSGALTVTGAATVVGTISGAGGVTSSKLQATASSTITATTGGGTTGLIAASTSFVTVSSDSVDKQITLPATSTATIGHVIRIKVGSTGCELICTGSGITINDVVCSATNELALTANSLYHCECVSSTAWVVRGITNLGADEAALVPDAL